MTEKNEKNGQMAEIFRKHLTPTQIKKLDDFFEKIFGINCDKLIGHEVSLKHDVRATLFLTPPHHYTVQKQVVIKKLTKLKIIDFDFQPLGYSNYFTVEIVNPQVELEKLSIDIHNFEKAMRINKPD